MISIIGTKICHYALNNFMQLHPPRYLTCEEIMPTKIQYQLQYTPTYGCKFTSIYTHIWMQIHINIHPHMDANSHQYTPTYGCKFTSVHTYTCIKYIIHLSTRGVLRTLPNIEDGAFYKNS